MEKNEIVCVDNNLIEERISIVQRQTEYTYEEAKSALKKNNYDTMYCIREYLGTPQKKDLPKKMSVNQQIYKELRQQLGTVTTPVYDPNA